MMRRFCLMASFVLCSLVPAGAQDAGEVAALRGAMQTMRLGDWDSAITQARRGGDLAGDIVQWHRLRASQGSFAEYQRFLARRGDWPGLPLLREKGETRIPMGAAPDQVRAYFGTGKPETGTGALRLAEALLETGNPRNSATAIANAWRGLPLTDDESAAFVARHAPTIAAQDQARMDMLLWRGRGADAVGLLPRVSDEWQTLAKARMGLRADAPGVDILVAAVPDALKSDAGLAYERFLWRAKKGLNDSAIALALERSTSAEALGDPARWASWRAVLARVAMRQGDGKTAYRLAARHFLTEGNDYADLEWLAGYIALRQLQDPKTALSHFQRLRVAVSSPISLGRAAYWEGRAHAAMGETEQARAAYAFGAEYQSSFYGLLAAEEAGLPLDPALTGTETYPDWRRAAFTGSSVFKAAMLLHRAGELELAERFLVHLAETLGPVELGQLSEVAFSLNEPHMALMIAKQAASQGIVLPRAYFPVTDLATQDLPVPKELALSIARRESEFNPKVVSGVGARGLMQIMPKTAAEVAGEIGVDFSLDRLLSDPNYNAKLGSAYLAKLVGDFGYAYVLVAAAYNAGPSRPKRWIEEQGDPRTSGVDAVDWIEAIQYTETRNYVMRVLESIPIYRARLSGVAGPVGLTDLLKAR